MPARISFAISERQGRRARSPTCARRPLPGVLLFALCATPGLSLVLRWHQGELGADPLKDAIHATGWWALTLLLLTLAITPLRRFSVWLSRATEARWGRRLADWNLLIRQRRQLGLWSFAYACAHLGLFAVLDAGSLPALLVDLADRPFIAWGMAALVLLLPLAATSTQGAMRRLRHNWSRLHLLVYPAAGAALVHAWQQTQVGHPRPWGFVVAALAWLFCRLWAWRAGDRHALPEDAQRRGAARRQAK